MLIEWFARHSFEIYTPILAVAVYYLLQRSIVFYARSYWAGHNHRACPSLCHFGCGFGASTWLAGWDPAVSCALHNRSCRWSYPSFAVKLPGYTDSWTLSVACLSYPFASDCWPTLSPCATFLFMLTLDGYRVNLSFIFNPFNQLGAEKAASQSSYEQDIISYLVVSLLCLDGSKRSGLKRTESFAWEYRRAHYR